MNMTRGSFIYDFVGAVELPAAVSMRFLLIGDSFIGSEMPPAATKKYFFFGIWYIQFHSSFFLLLFDVHTMGLAEVKNKQKLGPDPNNLHWSNGT